jgi:hypothetical protein
MFSNSSSRGVRPGQRPAGGGGKCGRSREHSLDGVKEDRLAGPSREGVETNARVILSLYAPNTYIRYS